MLVLSGSSLWVATATSRHVRHYYFRSEVFEENHRASKLLQHVRGAVERSMEMDVRNGCALSNNEQRGSELRRQRDHMAGKREINVYYARRAPLHAYASPSNSRL